MEIECVSPDAKPRFIYRTVKSYTLKDGVLVIQAPTSTVLYSIPAGSACEVRPVAKKSTDDSVFSGTL